MLQFFEVLRNGQNWAKKLIFLLILKVFLFTPSYTLWDTPQDFANWKTFLRYICGKLHQYSICGCELVFLYWFSIHEMAPFWDFLGPYSPKYCLILLELWPEVVSNKKNSAWKILQNLGFWLKWNVVSVHIGSQFTVGKPKILLKTKTSAKSASLGIINNVSPRSQKNHRILVKLSQKTLSRPKLGLRYNHGSKGHHKFSHSL